MMTPRPLPLFVDIVRQAAVTDPVLAASALRGARRYGDARRIPRSPPDATWQSHGISFSQRGLAGPPVLLVPSLINPHWVLDLDEDRSLQAHLAAAGFRAILIDWGKPKGRGGDDPASLEALIDERLRPAVLEMDSPPHIVGYCLGGTIGAGLAGCAPHASLTLIATPWHFTRYPRQTRDHCAALWQNVAPAWSDSGVVPIELFQSIFWAIDPLAIVSKFAAIADLAADDQILMRFARLEDWAGDGAALPFGIARQLFEQLIGDDLTGSGRWQVSGTVVDPLRLTAPCLQILAARDKIAPAETALDALPTIQCSSGHVGMLVGKRAPSEAWQHLVNHLASARQTLAP